MRGLLVYIPLAERMLQDADAFSVLLDFFPGRGREWTFAAPSEVGPLNSIAFFWVDTEFSLPASSAEKWQRSTYPPHSKSLFPENQYGCSCGASLSFLCSSSPGYVRGSRYGVGDHRSAVYRHTHYTLISRLSDLSMTALRYLGIGLCRGKGTSSVEGHFS
jgi:hypothetical protein